MRRTNLLCLGLRDDRGGGEGTGEVARRRGREPAPWGGDGKRGRESAVVAYGG